MKNNEDGIPQAEMTGEDWKAQKLVSAELRKLRELSGMTRKELADKMGAPYTEELVAQYEDGGVAPMELWPVFDMVRALRGDMNELDPERIISKRRFTNGYSDLTDESRAFVDRIIDTLIKSQNGTA
jgi:transcriptional regulator with XRE-family HTH domain